MRPLSKTFVVLAALLAVLMPLEQAHCAWMGLEKHAPAQKASWNHACCAPAKSASSQPAKAQADCACVQLPPGSLPAGIASAKPFASQLLVVPAPQPEITPVATLEAPAPAPDVWSPPLRVDFGAHGLRAPPFSA